MLLDFLDDLAGGQNLWCVDGNITHFDVKVSEVPIDTPKILSPREVVEQIKQHNPNFNQFLKDFDLGLA